MDRQVLALLNAVKKAIESEFESSLKEDRILHEPGFAANGVILRYNVSAVQNNSGLITIFARELISKLPVKGVLKMRDQPLIPEFKKDSAILLAFPHGLVSVDLDMRLQHQSIGARLEFDIY